MLRTMSALHAMTADADRPDRAAGRLVRLRRRREMGIRLVGSRATADARRFAAIQDLRSTPPGRLDPIPPWIARLERWWFKRWWLEVRLRQAPFEAEHPPPLTILGIGNRPDGEADLADATSCLLREGARPALIVEAEGARGLTDMARRAFPECPTIRAVSDPWVPLIRALGEAVLARRTRS